MPEYPEEFVKIMEKINRQRDNERIFMIDFFYLINIQFSEVLCKGYLEPKKILVNANWRRMIIQYSFQYSLPASEHIGGQLFYRGAQFVFSPDIKETEIYVTVEENRMSFNIPQTIKAE